MTGATKGEKDRDSITQSCRFFWNIEDKVSDSGNGKHCHLKHGLKEGIPGEKSGKRTGDVFQLPKEDIITWWLLAEHFQILRYDMHDEEIETALLIAITIWPGMGIVVNL